VIKITGKETRLFLTQKQVFPFPLTFFHCCNFNLKCSRILTYKLFVMKYSKYKKELNFLKNSPIKRVSGWLVFLTPGEPFSHLYHCENKLHFDKMRWYPLCTRPIH